MRPYKRRTSSTIKRDKDDDPYPLSKAFSDRGKVILTMLADTGLLAFWVILAWGFNVYVLEPIGKMTGLDRIILTALQAILGLPIILQSLAFTIIDLSGLLSSTIEVMKKQWKK